MARVTPEQVTAPERRSRREALPYRALGVAIRSVYAALAFFFRVVPREEGVELGAAISSFLSNFVPGRRRIVLENLATAFPEKSEAERRRIMRAAFANMGRTVVEVLRAPLHTKRELERILEVRDVERWVVHARAKRGVFALSAHLGSFELIASFGSRVVGVTCGEVVRRIEPAALDDIATQLRHAAGVTPIPAKGAIRGILRGLKDGWGIGYVLDQNARRGTGVFVPFFGKLASTSKGLAVLAQRTKAPVLPIFIHRVGHLGRHRLVFHPELAWDASAGDGEAAIVHNTAIYTRIVEDEIRRHPEDWFWFHQRWRTRPLEELEAAARAREQVEAESEQVESEVA
jgi:KDO2-lipid IV(A) lauroyltransferase